MNAPEGSAVERQRRCFAKELLTLLPYSASVAVLEELFSQLLFFRLPEATAHVEAAALTEFAMSV